MFLICAGLSEELDRQVTDFEAENEALGNLCQSRKVGYILGDP